MTQQQWCFETSGNTCGLHDCPLITKYFASQIHGQPATIWWVCPETGTRIRVRN